MPRLCRSSRKSAHPLMPPPRRSPASGTVGRSCPPPLGRPPACAPPLTSLGCDLLAAVLVRARLPAAGYGAAPVWRPRSGSSADVGCAAWRSAPVVLCRPNRAARGQPAIAGRLPHGREPLHLSYFQRPSQGQDLTHPGNRLQSHHPLAELRIFPEALQQPSLDRSEKHHLFST